MNSDASWLRSSSLPPPSYLMHRRAVGAAAPSQVLRSLITRGSVPRGPGFEPALSYQAHCDAPSFPRRRRFETEPSPFSLGGVREGGGPGPRRGEVTRRGAAGPGLPGSSSSSHGNPGASGRVNVVGLSVRRAHCRTSRSGATGSVARGLVARQRGAWERERERWGVGKGPGPTREAEPWHGRPARVDGGPAGAGAWQGPPSESWRGSDGGLAGPPTGG